jgi:LPS-assembly lipoprotein
MPLRTPGRVLVAAGLILLLAGCGFKLRGTVEIPPELNPLYVDANGATELVTAIRQRLEFSQVRLASSPQDARVVLRILGEERGSRVAAVDRDGKMVAGELRYVVNFEALGKDGKALVPPQAINLVRTYQNPDVEVLGKQLEADLIFQDLVQDAADRILGRLRATLL